MRISYALSNLKRLGSTPSIEIRPITLLLGRNSAGKSTFLRSFPLLRQSLETKASAPVLWYGDYVDFGNFHGSVKDNDESKTISFSFQVEDFTAAVPSSEYYSLDRGDIRHQNRSIALDNVSIDYRLRSNGGSTERDSINIKLSSLDANLIIDFDKSRNFAKSLVLNGEELKQIFSEVEFFFPQDNIFAAASFFRKGKEGRLVVESRQSVFINAIQKELARYVDGRIGLATVRGEAYRIVQKNTLNDEALNSLKITKTKKFREIYGYLQSGGHKILRKRLNAICLLNHFFQIIEAVNVSLSSYFRSVEYIGPARARSERFYRQQELEVSEISPDGRNLPMFLASLTAGRLERFSGWVEKMFGYGVAVKKTEGHISINLEQSGKSVNVVDTGYGVSQVLPVLAQIWWMQQGGRDRRFVPARSANRKLLAIEQPELHLHPAHQALLADVFVEAIGNRAQPAPHVQLSLLIETHSEAIVNRIGELIARGEVSSNDVQVVIFSDENDHTNDTKVNLSTYDENGLLQNWPYGFFEYSVT